jgi:hypothetical protein
MSVYKNAGAWDASNVKTDGAWVLSYVKGTKDPAYDSIDYGAIALRRALVARVPAGEPAALDALQHAWAAEKKLRALVVTERFYEIGSPEGLAATDAKLRTLSEGAQP